MLIVALLKGVPGRATKVVRNDNILQREVMEMVLNPNDVKAIEAAEFLRRQVGGKIAALTMGPEAKLKPLLEALYGTESRGLDEAFIISDPRMAGSDTIATAYVLAHGVVKILERHLQPIDTLIALIKRGATAEVVEAKARELYHANLLPNKVYTEVPGMRESITERFVRADLTAEQVIRSLEFEKKIVGKLVVVAGIRTADGETGSVGPQVAEALAEALDLDLPHATYVEDLMVDPSTLKVTVERRIGRSVQKLEMDCPSLLTIAPEFVPRLGERRNVSLAKENSYKGKVKEATKWNGEDLAADPSRLGFLGSAVIVGPAVLVNRPDVQKVLDKSLVFAKAVPKLTWEGTEYGPFGAGDMAEALPGPLQERLTADRLLVSFSVQMLAEEMFG